MELDGSINLVKLKENVQQKFTEIRAALELRERLLMRQIDVINTSQQQQIGRGGTNSSSNGNGRTRTNVNIVTNAGKEIEFLAEQEAELLAAIRSFGRFQLDNINLALQDAYLKNEDYIAPSDDHETMYKCLQQADQPVEGDVDDTAAIVVDFSRNKSLIEHNAKHMNESIINITLQEAKELIRKAKVKRETPVPPLNLEELDDELESSIAEAVSTLGHDSPPNTKSSQTCLEAKKLKKGCFKPKITINNCNGTINLRNITSLTINCASEDAVKAEIPLRLPNEEGADEPAHKFTQNSNYQSTSSSTTPQPSVIVETSASGNTTPCTTASSSNYSSNASSRSQSKKQKQKQAAASKNLMSTSNSNMQPSCASAYPYEIVDDDDACEAHNAAATCDFYNRLLNEIKNSLKQKAKQHPLNIVDTNSAESMPTEGNDHTSASCMSSAKGTTTSSARTVLTSPPQPSKRLILKNFENLKIILEANSDEETFHPIQIEQWLAEIISETDVEPMQNTEILEHSKIHNDST